MNGNDIIGQYPDELMTFLKELAVIPAPSLKEGRRAAFCLGYLHERGVGQAFLDDAGNVCIPFTKDDNKPITVIMAHCDLVFDEETELRVTEDRTWLCCPGIGDNTVHVAALIQYAVWLNEKHCEKPLLFVINVGEEGLGNLRGSRAIVEKYGRRIDRLITFDSVTDEVVTKAVGSIRWKAVIETEGGHSFRHFGKPNAIILMADLIEELKASMTDVLAVTAARDPAVRATWNIGAIEGGTSVNTIAPSASMLFECRADDREALAAMREAFEKTVRHFASSDHLFVLKADIIGIRPCMKDVDFARHEELIKLAEDVILRQFKKAPVRTSGSTDANSALAAGIPAICFGLCQGEGAHTVYERIMRDSLLPGLNAGWDFILRL